VVAGGYTFGLTSKRDVKTTQSQDFPWPESPRRSTIEILALVRRVSADCTCAFGGEKASGPVPSFEDSFAATRHPDGRTIGGGGNLSPGAATARGVVELGLGLGGANARGLGLDVARAFATRVEIFPRPGGKSGEDGVSEGGFSNGLEGAFGISGTSVGTGSGIGMGSGEFVREAVVASVLRVTFRALAENVRLQTVDKTLYRCIQVDVAFLRHMVPHYVGGRNSYGSGVTNNRGSGFGGAGSGVSPTFGKEASDLFTLLDEILLNAGERCVDTECIDAERYYDANTGEVATPLSIVEDFMVHPDTGRLRDDVVSSFVIDIGIE